MTYLQMADMTRSASLRDRLTACAAQQHARDPEQWVRDNIWSLVTQPGWADAWASAVASAIEDPGANEAVITDQMILSAVQPMLSTI